VRVLLISGNREMNPEPPFPLGCAYLVRALTDQGHEVSTLDLLFEKDAHAAIIETIDSASPEVIGLSMRNLDLLTFPQMKSEIPEYKRYVSVIRNVTRVPIVVGGSGFSLAPEACLEAIGADVGIAGEGEVALPALLTKIRLADGIVPIELVGKVLRSPPGVDINVIRPDFDAFDIERYYREGSGGTVQTRRGCNLTCNYCTYPLLEGHRIRPRHPQEVIHEMAELRERYSVDHITFVDSVFNSPERHAIDVVEAIAKLDPPVKWTAFFHPVFKDPGFLRAVRESGCEGLDLGVDSLSETVLARMRKGFHPREVIAFCDACRKVGLKFNLSMLFGAPGETTHSVDETLSCIERCDPDSVTVGIGVRLYPGAPVTEELIASGDVAPDQVGVETLYYISENVRNSLVERLRAVASDDSRWIIPGLGVNYNPRFLRRLRKHGRKGPIWHLVGG
jgi:radical SAM superfamily enzyme YgiQ (UPF0313 family)